MTNKSIYVKDWRRRTKRKLLAAFGNKCAVCSYDKCVAALEFHHMDPSEKEFSFGSFQSKSWDKIVVEIKKCVCLCANCHREVHSGDLILSENIQKFDESLIEFNR